MPELGEFEIIERFFDRSAKRAHRDAGVRIGIGDDAAVVDAAGPLAVAVDMLAAGTHFPPELPADAVGHRALAVNLSDLAAVAAKPRWATLALCLPEADETWLEGFAAGFHGLAERFDVALIGGDTTRGPLTVAVQLIGEASDEPPLRSGGRAGDLIFVSGTLGDATAGLAAVLEDPDAGTRAGVVDTATAALAARFCYPEPRVALGAALAGLARAAIDISDGLVADLGHVLRQSRCGAELDLAALPLSEALSATRAAADARELALNGGDDYELCFCVAPANRDRVFAAAEAAATPVTEIGMLTAEPGLLGRLDGRSFELEPRGFRHF